MIKLVGASKSFDGQVALHPIDLDVPVGQVTVLIGPSGCGKSTLLRMICGLIEPTSGEVRFDGQTVTPATVQAVRRRIGYVIQDGGLFPHFTARQNVTLMARHVGRPAAVIEARLKDLAALTQFPLDGLDRYPTELSGGQRQRVSLMRALMLQPDALLLDEPLGALDPMVRASLQSDLRGIFRELGQTVVMVTHDMGEAAYFGDQIVLLREGRIAQVGSVREFEENPAEPFVSEFLQAQRSYVPGGAS